MAFRDHHSRAATPEYKSACDAMGKTGWGSCAGDTARLMDTYLREGRDDESFPEWKARTLRDDYETEYEEAKERIQRMLGRAF